MTQFSSSDNAIAIQGQIYSKLYYGGTDTTSYDFNGNNSNVQMIQLTAGQDCTITPSNLQAGARYCLIVKQASTPTGSVTWDSSIYFAGGADVSISASADARDVLSFIAESSNILLCITSTQELS
jgi:hypothetical protein